MSAAAPVLGPQSLVRPVGRRRHLHLVPDLPQVTADVSGRLRLTVRGRRVLLGLVAIVAAALMLTTAAVASGPDATESVTVRSGQTLSDIAREQLPDLPVGTGVAQLQTANQLNSLHVSAGQRLTVPSP